MVLTATAVEIPLSSPRTSLAVKQRIGVAVYKQLDAYDMLTERLTADATLGQLGCTWLEAGKLPHLPPCTSQGA